MSSLRKLRLPMGRAAWLWGAAVIIMLAGVVVTQQLRNKLLNTLAQLNTLEQALVQSTELLAFAVDLDTGLRGYLLSGDRLQLQPYENASALLPQRTESTAVLLKNDPDAATQVRMIEGRLLAKQAELITVIAMYETHGREAAFAATNPDLNKPETDNIRALIIRLQQRISSQVLIKQAALQRVVAQSSAALLITLGLAAAASVFSLILLRRHVATLHEENLLREEMLRSQNENRAKSLFVANMSHEIRTPLNAIFGFTRLLQERLSDPVNSRYLSAIDSSGRALLNLIEDLLDLSKIEAGKMVLRNAPASLPQIAEDVASMFADQARQKGLFLRTRNGAGLPHTVMIDGGRVRQVLLNLVQNAVKYTDVGGIIIKVSARPDRSHADRVHCYIQVRDSGIGIHQEELSGVFDPFTRAREVASGKRSGTGLGLTITRQLVRLMGGEIKVRSRKNEGSVFRISLPGLSIAQPTQDGSAGAPTLADLPASDILIVDDVELNRELLLALFNNTHHRVAVASGGEEAVRIGRRDKPDLILMDVLMPGVDGIEAAQRLRADPGCARTVIVAVSASTMARDRAQLQQVFDGYVHKPLTPETLYNELAKVFAHRARAAPTARSPQARPAAAPEVLIEVAEDLERLTAQVSPGLREAPALHEVRDFSSMVGDLARRSQYEPLEKYASALSSAAVSFDVARTEALLRDFPQRVEQFRAFCKKDAGKKEEKDHA